jgi:anti-anti-sigma factor
VNDEMNDDADSRPQLRLHAYHPRLDVLVVGVDGELDLLTAQELHACLVRPRRNHLVLDLSRVTFLDSSGLCVLIEVAAASDVHGTLHLVGVFGSRRTLPRHRSRPLSTG